MSFISIQRTSLSEAPSETAPLDATSFAAICLTTCKRLPAMRRTAEAQRLDAALALIAIELPRWKLRRLAYDEGEWHCALSNQRDLPDWLDSAVETHHPDMATAILDAFRAVVSRGGTPHLTQAPVRAIQPTDSEPMLCENYC
ncbi:hypothetical protein [Tardiphaga sp. 768_D3_N2_1]|uniref:hypothetical protein n=1 Tax=Tardiphaga sp. 768_D3_N2_1 TaxID=3240783 RepID=UPI003F8AC557